MLPSYIQDLNVCEPSVLKPTAGRYPSRPASRAGTGWLGTFLTDIPLKQVIALELVQREIVKSGVGFPEFLEEAMVRLDPSEVEILFVKMESVRELYEEINVKVFVCLPLLLPSFFLSLQPVLISHITQDKAKL